MPNNKGDDPLIILPPADKPEVVSPAPRRGQTQPAVRPTSAPLQDLPIPKTVAAPEGDVTSRAPPPAAQGVPIPSLQGDPLSARPRAFQLVNPIRRQENSIPVAPLDLSAPLERAVIQAQPVAQTNPVSSDPVVAGNTTPQITIAKRGPASPRAGEPLQFTIVVHNLGQTPAMQIRVEDEIPLGARVVFADPQPVLQNDRAVWVIPMLAAGADKQLKMELEAKGGGELVGTTTVWVSAATGMRTRIDPSVLTLAVKPIAAVPAGFPVIFEIQVTNHGKQALTGLVLHGNLPAGLTHPMGKEIEADVGDLGPGATKTYKMPVTAGQPGRHAVEVKITTPGGLEARGQGNVQVTPATRAGLSVHQPPSVRLYLDKQAELRIDVTNHQTQGLKNVAVVDSVPEGVDFVAASDRGLFRPDARVAHWLIDYLAPGQSKILTLRVRAKTSRQFANNVIARTEAQQETQSSAQIQVQGASDLLVKVTDRENPIEVGKTAVYEIKVTNQGSAAATGVQVQATLPEGMAPSQARGPTHHRMDGRQITFASLPKLQPQGQAVYYVTALAQAPGDQRFRALVVSDQTAAPIAREERTFVYRD
jgi:uncharacterized repeat protein (TIGR01451 family)